MKVITFDHCLRFCCKYSRFHWIAAAVMSLIGVMLMCWTDVGNIQIKGLFMSGYTVITYALYIVGINQTKTGREIEAEPLTFYILLVSTLMFFIYAMTSGGIGQIPSFPALGRILSLSILATVISDLTLVLAIKYIGSTITSILGSMEPLIAVLIGVSYFSETFTGYTLAGFILIITSVCIVVAKSSLSDIKRIREEYHQDD